MSETPDKQPWTAPVLRWAGSKRKLLPTLMSLVPANYYRYVEPFAGSACLFFAIRPSRAVLADINTDLMATYEAIRSHPRLVARKAADRPRTKRYYYWLRDHYAGHADGIEQAARFIYLNRHCFNGIYRTNLEGRFNVPRGSRTGALPSERAFYRCALSLKAAKLRAWDFERTLAEVRADDFVYLDPPFFVRDNRVFREYATPAFSSRDLTRLVAALQRLDRIGSRFLMSYADTPQSRELFCRWRSRAISTQRSIAGFTGNRRTASELLVSNFLTF